MRPRWVCVDGNWIVGALRAGANGREGILLSAKCLLDLPDRAHERLGWRAVFGRDLGSGPSRSNRERVGKRLTIFRNEERPNPHWVAVVVGYFQP